MELQLVQTEGTAVAQGAVWKECVITAVKGRWP